VTVVTEFSASPNNTQQPSCDRFTYGLLPQTNDVEVQKCTSRAARPHAQNELHKYLLLTRLAFGPTIALSGSRLPLTANDTHCSSNKQFGQNYPILDTSRFGAGRGLLLPHKTRFA